MGLASDTGHGLRKEEGGPSQAKIFLFLKEVEKDARHVFPPSPYTLKENTLKCTVSTL